MSGLELHAKRDSVLSFIDPAAFFGLHYEEGVHISVFNGSTKKLETKKQNELYTLLLEKFATKNRVYLDIRSEKGYSYNFYENYNDGSGNNIKIGNNATSPVVQPYATFGWPVISVDTTQTTTETFNTIKINLRVDDNIKPILFFENKEILGSNNNGCFLDETKIVNGTNVDWSKDINLFFPNTGTGASKNNISYYLKLYYFRQEYNTLSPNTILKNQFYFDNSFASIDLENIADIDYTFQNRSNSNVSYTRGLLPNVTSKFSFVGETGVNWDANRVLFYNKAIFKNHRTSKFFNPIASKTNTGFSLEGNFNKTSFLSTRIALNVNSLQEIVSTGVYNPVKVLDIIKNDDFSNAYEDLFCFGITQTEFTILKNLTGFTNKHHRYIYLEEVLNSPFNDKDNKVFRKFEVKIQGLDNNGNRLISGASTPIYAYSQNGLVFASKDFALMENLSNVELNYEEKFHLESNYYSNLNQIPSSSLQYLYETIGADLKVIVDSFKTEINLLTSANFNSSIENIILNKGSQLLNTARTKIKDANSAMHNKDGAFYLARLQMRKAFKEQSLVASYFISDGKREEYLDLLEKVTRGLHTSNIPNFSSHPNHIPILITGYDPFYSAFNDAKYFDIDNHISNSSGNLSLSLNDVEIISGVKKAIIKSAILPVRYKEFNEGWIENFFEPYINPNHSNYQPVKMIITTSYGVDSYKFQIDRFSSRYRNPDLWDNNFLKAGISDYLVNSDKNSLEFIETTLPFNDLRISNKIELHQKVKFDYYNNNQPTGKKSEFNLFGISSIVPFPNITNYPPPQGTSANKLVAKSGSGGTYLSNEIFYRVSYLRNKYNPTLKTGHIHIGFLKEDNLSLDRIEMIEVFKQAVQQVLINL